MTIDRRVLRPFLTGLATGIALLVAFIVLSVTPIVIGPWALNGNGALAMLGIGVPVAIYAGWTALAGRSAGRTLALELAGYGVGLCLGMGPLAIFFGLPMVMLAGATYAALVRRRPQPPAPVAAVVLGAAAVIAGLPAVGLLGLGLLPGSATALAAGRPRNARIVIGAVLVALLVAVVFVAPLVTSSLSGAPGPGTP